MCCGAMGKRSAGGVGLCVHRFSEVFDDKACTADATDELFPAMQKLDRTRFAQPPRTVALRTARRKGGFSIIGLSYLVVARGVGIDRGLKAGGLFVLADVQASRSRDPRDFVEDTLNARARNRCSPGESRCQTRHREASTGPPSTFPAIAVSILARQQLAGPTPASPHLSRPPSPTPRRPRRASSAFHHLRRGRATFCRRSSFRATHRHPRWPADWPVHRPSRADKADLPRLPSSHRFFD